MEKMDTGYGGASLAWLLCNKREMYYSLMSWGLAEFSNLRIVVKSGT